MFYYETAEVLVNITQYGTLAWLTIAYSFQIVVREHVSSQILSNAVWSFIL